MTPEENLTKAIAAAYGVLPPKERAKKIRELCRDGNKDFIKKSFPQFYKEAFPNG
jgi:hypothetical protein